MYWQKRLERINPDANIEEVIVKLREQHKDYGYRRITGALKKLGYVINKKKVQRLMQKLGLQVTTYSHKSRKYKSYKGKIGKVAPNRLRRRFKTSIPHQKITTDTTELKYYEVDSKGNTMMQKLYLDPFMDMYNGEIVSFSISKRPTSQSIMSALYQAIEITSDCSYRRTFHSDQGWAYQMSIYSKELKRNKIFQSMSRKGNCLDNAMMENFFSILKQEMYYGKRYESYESLVKAIEKFIEYYNHHRIKERLNWMSPVEYRHCYACSVA